MGKLEVICLLALFAVICQCDQESSQNGMPQGGPPNRGSGGPCGQNPPPPPPDGAGPPNDGNRPPPPPDGFKGGPCQAQESSGSTQK